MYGNAFTNSRWLSFDIFLDEDLRGVTLSPTHTSAGDVYVYCLDDNPEESDANDGNLYAITTNPNPYQTIIDDLLMELYNENSAIDTQDPLATSATAPDYIDECYPGATWNNNNWWDYCSYTTCWLKMDRVTFICNIYMAFVVGLCIQNWSETISPQ